MAGILLFHHLLAVRSTVFRRETVIIVDLILILLHVITAPCIDPLLVGFVRIIAAIPLLLWLPANHAAELAISDSIVPLLLHLLIQLMEGRGFLERAAVCRCCLSLSLSNLEVD